MRHIIPLPVRHLLLPLSSTRFYQDFLTVFLFVEHLDHIQISDQILNVLILSEDRRFFRHPGVDLIAIARALWSILVKRRLQGASTIEQQLVRTLTKRYELTLRCKLREITLALLVSLSSRKSQIARSYLQVAYFGWQMNGLLQACKRLHINPSTASALEAATVIARLKYPEPQFPSPYRQAQIQNGILHILGLRTPRTG